jgi:hypothetical protein
VTCISKSNPMTKLLSKKYKQPKINFLKKKAN